jgi:hypothetical protein
MKEYMRSLILGSLLVIALLPLRVAAQGQDIESMPPVVVKTVPEAGSKDVSPGTMEITVSFSKKMKDGSWSWSTAWEGSAPEMIGKPRYEATEKRAFLKGEARTEQNVRLLVEQRAV